MPRFHLALPAAGLLLAAFAWPQPAAAQAQPPAGLLGAWGADSSCTADVAVFRADGTVTNPDAGPGMPATTYAVDGDSITFTQGKQTGQFAFGLSDQAVAWSNGSAMVLKERCANQSAFAALAKSQERTGSLFDQIKTLAAEPLVFNGVPIKVVGVDAHPAGTQGKAPIFSEVVAHPSPDLVGPDATLIYRVFPTARAAADYVTLARDKHTGFVYEARGAGFFSTASAVDEGPNGHGAKPVTIDCLRFHPKRATSVTVTCFAQLPGSQLVAGGQQGFPLPKASKPNDTGPKEDLSETLDLTGLAIDTLRGFLAQNPNP